MTTKLKHDNKVVCPICHELDSAVLYGQQGYLVGDTTVPSHIYQCKSCDLNFRRFDKPLNDIVNHFKVAPYSSDEVEQRWLQRRAGFYEYLLDLLEQPAGGKQLLDIGCAFGHFLDVAVARGYEPFGTEVSVEMADLLRKRREYPVSSRPLSDLRLPVEKFDVITFVDSFYYFEDPLMALRQCHKMLKPGGKLLMRITNRNPLARLHHLVSSFRTKPKIVPQMPFWTTDDAVSCHSQKSISKAMVLAGFRIQKLTCIEKGKRIDSLGLRMFYSMTTAMVRLSFGSICWTPGLVCLAVKQTNPNRSLDK